MIYYYAAIVETNIVEARLRENENRMTVIYVGIEFQLSAIYYLGRKSPQLTDT